MKTKLRKKLTGLGEKKDLAMLYKARDFIDIFPPITLQFYEILILFFFPSNSKNGHNKVSANLGLLCYWICFVHFYIFTNFMHNIKIKFAKLSGVNQSNVSTNTQTKISMFLLIIVDLSINSKI